MSQIQTDLHKYAQILLENIISSSICNLLQGSAFDYNYWDEPSPKTGISTAFQTATLDKQGQNKSISAAHPTANPDEDRWNRPSLSLQRIPLPKYFSKPRFNSQNNPSSKTKLYSSIKAGRCAASKHNTYSQDFQKHSKGDISTGLLALLLTSELQHKIPDIASKR